MTTPNPRALAERLLALAAEAMPPVVVGWALTFDSVYQRRVDGFRRKIRPEDVAALARLALDQTAEVERLQRLEEKIRTTMVNHDLEWTTAYDGVQWFSDEIERLQEIVNTLKQEVQR